MNNDLVFSIFKNGVAKEKGWDLKCSELVDKIKNSEELEKPTIEAREIYHQLKLAKAKMKELENRDDDDHEKQEVVKKTAKLKKAYTDAKKKLPLITTHAFFEKGRKDMDPHTFYNLILVDVDHIPNEEVQRLMADVKERPYILFANRSVSGEGYHFLVAVNVDGGMNDENFKDVFEATIQYVEWDLKISADRKVGTISRCMFLNHDAEIHYNPNVQALDMNVGLYLQRNDFINIINNNEMKEEERLEKYLDEADPNLNWNVGNRHATLVALTTQLNKNGFSKERVVSVCCQRYPEPDFDRTEITETIDDIYDRYASEHGTNQKGFTLKKDKGTKGHIATNIPEELLEDDWDEDEILCTPCPDVTILRQYIPDFLYDYVVDPHEGKEVQFASVLALLTASGAMMRYVECPVNKHETFFPQTFLAVIGEAASGKSCINRAMEIFKIHADAIEAESRNKAKQRLDEIKAWEQCMKKRKEEEDCGCGSEPKKIEPLKINMSLSISKSKLEHHLSINNTIPSLIKATEMDSMIQNKEMLLSATLRAISENEPVGSSTHTHGVISADCPKASLLVAGTPGQLVRYFGNREDGLLSRHFVVHLPHVDYIPLVEYHDSERYYDDKRKEFECRTLTFSKYVSERRLRLKLTANGLEIINCYFKTVETRFGKFASEALRAFERRLRGHIIRVALVLTVCKLYQDNAIDGRYDIPTEIIRTIVTWCDYLIQQHILLLNYLPEVINENGGKEMKYAQIYDKLPCEFTKKDVVNLFGEEGKSSKTAQRTIKKWIKAGLLKKHLLRYQKIECV